MTGLKYRIGRVFVLVGLGILAVSAFVFGEVFEHIGRAIADGTRNSGVSGMQKTLVKNSADPFANDVPEAEYRERLARISQLANEGNFEELVKEGDAIRDIWGTVGGERYAKLILQMTSALGLSRIVDDHPEARGLREKYAITALANSDSYSIESELHLAMELRYSTGAPDLSDAEAAKLRHNSKLWLHLLARLERERDPSFDLEKTLSLSNHLITPLELRLIKDPVEKARLEALEAAHQEKLKKLSYQYRLQNVTELAELLGTKFFSNAYSRPPFSREELSTLLSEYAIAISLRSRILKATDEIIAQKQSEGRDQ